MLTLYAATSNAGKLGEFRAAARQTQLPLAIEPVPGIASLPACVEDGLTFEENARIKAAHYSGLAGGLVFADDSGLEVPALGGAPGVHSARYSGPGANDGRNNKKLLAALGDLEPARRQARFVCFIALAEAGRVLGVFRGAAEGVMLEAPRGSNGFGYDPLFLFPPLGRTFAELSPEEKLQCSHRGRAFRALLSWLPGRLVGHNEVSMAVTQITVPRAGLAEFCRGNGIRKLSLFGSVLTGRFSEGSDVDVLVEFEPTERVGYLRMAAIERELSALFGRRIDLRTAGELSPYFREDVVRTAAVQYARE